MDVEGAPASLWDGHLVLLPWGKQDHDASLAAWVRRGLVRGELVVLTLGHDEPEAVPPELYRDVGVGRAHGRRVGQVVALPPEQFYSPRGQDQLIAQAFAQGFSGVRLNAQAGTALSIMSEREYLAAEQAMDRHCRLGSLSAICAYPRPAPADQPLRETLATHSGGVRAVRFSSLRGPNGMRLFGEVDLVTSDVLAAAIHAAVATRTAPDELVLDLSGLDFIDVAGSRTLLRATTDFRAAGGQLLLAGTQPSVARILSLLDVDRAPGVRVLEEPP